MEKKVYLYLKDWFERSGVNCYLNYGKNGFTTKGSRKKPDLILLSKKLNQWIVVEVKVGNISKDIYDANKIIDYWSEYTENKIKYFIKNQEITISSFAVATFFSPFGKLFQEDNELKGMDDAKDQWAKMNIEKGIEPMWEYAHSRQYLRNLWANWRRIRKKEESAGIGIVFSNILNKENFIEGIDVPLLFDQQREFNKRGRQWKVRQKIL